MHEECLDSASDVKVMYIIFLDMFSCLVESNQMYVNLVPRAVSLVWARETALGTRLNVRLYSFSLDQV